MWTLDLVGVASMNDGGSGGLHPIGHLCFRTGFKIPQLRLLWPPSHSWSYNWLSIQGAGLTGVWST